MLSASRKHVQRHPAWLSGALRISTNLRAVQRNQESPAETECPEPSFIGRQTGTRAQESLSREAPVLMDYNNLKARCFGSTDAYVHVQLTWRFDK